MDAAHKLLNKTALLFATALLIAAPVQAQSLIVSSNTVGLSDNQAKSIQVTASGSSTVTYTVTGVPFWLNVTSSAGFQTPDILFFQLTNTNCGVCTATVNLTPTGGTAVPITVTYAPGGGGGGGGNGTLTANPTSLSLSGTPGGAAVSQGVTLSTSTSSVTITGINTDAPSWLSAFVSAGSFTVTPSSSATLTVSANPFSLTSGTYTGHITVTPNVGTATTITVTFTVGSGGGTGTLSVNPNSLAFSAAPGQTSTPQNLTISNPTTTAVSVGIGSDVTWLSAQVVSGAVSSVTNASPLVISVAANAGTLTNGTYTGHLIITPGVGTPTTVTVTFTVGTGGGGGGGGSNGTITANPTSLSFTASAGQNAAAQNVTLNSASAVTVLGINSNVSWLSTTITTGSLTIGPTAPGNLSIVASAAALANGTYNGQLTITPSTGTPTIIAVTFTVGSGGGGGGGGGTGSIQVDHTSFAFNYPSSTLSAVLNISAGTSGQSTFNVVVASQSNWMRFSVNNVPSGTYNNVGFGQFLVSVDPTVASTLNTGTYTGSLSLINPSNSNDVTTVSLTLAVNGGGGGGSGNLTVTPTNLNFTASPGGAPQQQNLTLTVPSGTSVQFTATAFNSGFLSVSSPGCAGSVNSTTPLTCTLFGPQTITVTVNPGALTILGDYTGQLQFVSGGVTVNAFVKMTLTAPVTSLTVNPTSLNFSASAGGASQTQTVAIAVPGQAQTQVSLTSFNGNFFTVSSSSCNLTPGNGTICTFTGNQTLNVTVNPSTLSATGVYNGIITIQSGGISQNVSVSLNLNSSGGGTTTTIAAPAALTFAYQIGSGAIVPQQLITIAASGSFTATASVQTAQQWLAASTIGTGPGGYVTVSVSPQGLGAGTYQGNVAITTTSGNITIPVTLTVSSGVVVLSTPGALNFISSSSSVQTQTLTLQASDNSATPVTLTTSASWIAIGTGSSANTPSTFVVTVSPGSLCNGLNTGTLTVGASNASNNGFTIPVVVLVSNSTATGCSNSGGTVLTVSPTSLTFAAQPGGSAPAAQSITVTSASGSSGTSFTYSLSGNLTGTATVNGTAISNGQTLATPATITFTPSTAGLTAGTTYNATITLTPVGGGAAVTVPLTLTVSSTPVVTATPTTLSFTYAAGTAVPNPLTVTVGGAAGLTFTATASSTGNWLSVAPSSGTTPATLMVAANPTGLAAGSYTGTITVTGTGSASGSTTITVTLTITAPLPTITSVGSAASYLGGSISPGELITIFGTSIGPTPGVTLTLDSTGSKVSTTLAGVQVLVNGFQAPIVYASNTQVSAVVPYEICASSCGPGTIAQVVVKFLGQSSNGIPTPVSSTAPGVFTANASGSGPGAILNANSSVNSPANPANKGDVIAIYLTGEGLTSPAGVTGKVTTVASTSPITPVPLLPVAATIDGTPVNISFAGEAPGIVSGVMQLNVQIPAGARSGNLPLVVSIGGANSQAGVTVSVK